MITESKKAFSDNGRVTKTENNEISMGDEDRGRDKRTARKIVIDTDNKGGLGAQKGDIIQPGSVLVLLDDVFISVLVSINVGWV